MKIQKKKGMSPFPWPHYNFSNGRLFYIFDLPELDSCSFLGLLLFTPALWGFRLPESPVEIKWEAFLIVISRTLLPSCLPPSPVFKNSLLLCGIKLYILHSFHLLCVFLYLSAFFTILNWEWTLPGSFIVNGHSLKKERNYIVCFADFFQQLNGLPEEAASRSRCCNHHTNDWAWVTIIGDLRGSVLTLPKWTEVLYNSGRLDSAPL